MLRTPRGVLLLAIVGGTLLRLVAGVLMGLGIDEAYEVTNGRDFELSFFDHPPLSFWLATVVTKMTGSDAALLVRLPFILLFIGTTWLLFRLTSRLLGEWAGAWAAVLFNLNPLFAIVAGGWVMPDGPLLFGVLASAVCLLPIFEEDAADVRATRAWRAWLGAGFWLGVAMLSKYLAVLYAAGVVLYVLATPRRRRWLVHPAPYLGVALAFVVFSPVLIWNAQREWVSFAFQGSRANPEGLEPLQVLVSIGGQALYLLPWIWWPLVCEGVKAVRDGTRSPATWCCVCLAAPAILLMTIIPLWGSKGLPHWTAVGYVFLFPILGHAVATQIDGPARRLIRGWLRFAAVSFPLILLVLSLHAATGWGRALMPESVRDDDPTHDMLSWKPVGELLETNGLRAEDGVFLVALHWIEGAKLGHAMGAEYPVTVFTTNPHNFPFITDQESLLGRDAVFVAPERRFKNFEKKFGDHFESFERLGTVDFERLMGPEESVELWRGRNFLRPYDEWPY